MNFVNLNAKIAKYHYRIHWCITESAEYYSIDRNTQFCGGWRESSVWKEGSEVTDDRRLTDCWLSVCSSVRLSF